jgi:hypothetical protein
LAALVLVSAACGACGSGSGSTGEAETPTARAPASTLPSTTPWKLVGAPALIDVNAPSRNADGTTTYDLWFRTEGDFRRVRPHTNPLATTHYAIGKIVIPGLPGRARPGIDDFRLALNAGHYCWDATVYGLRRGSDELLRRQPSGTEFDVVFRLPGAPKQTATASIEAPSSIVRQYGSLAALGCRAR